MTVEFENFNRKTFRVQAVRVTPLNMQEIAEACGGRIMHDGQKEGNFSRDYIKVRVAYPLNERQTEAHVGDWLVKQGGKFKVYQDNPFRKNFEMSDGRPVPKDDPKPEDDTQKSHSPSPSDMPKHKPEIKAEEGPELTEVSQGTPVAAEPVAAPDVTPPAEVLHADFEPSPEAVAESFPENSPEGESQEKSVVSEPEREQLTDDELREMGFPTSTDEGYEPIYRDELEPENLQTPAAEEEKKPITLDELNAMPGDPRSAQEIMNER